MSIFSKAAQGLNLTPAQRAFLKLLKGWFYTALSIGVMAGAQYLLNNQQVNWTALLYIAGGAFLLSLLGALDKFWTAHGDAPLALLTEAGLQRVEQIASPIQAQPRPIGLPSVQTLHMPFQSQDTPMSPVAVPQVPFLFPVNSMTSGASAGLYSVYNNPVLQPISFGDTGVMPVIPTK